MRNGLQVYEMRTSSPVKRESLSERLMDGAILIMLAGMICAIWFMAGYLLANV